MTTPRKDVDTIRQPTDSDLDVFLSKLLDLGAPMLPLPKQPSKCPLFCCFYAEFDIKVGPIISFQSPKHFMDQDINIGTEQIQQMLSKTFENLNNEAEGVNGTKSRDDNGTPKEGPSSPNKTEKKTLDGSTGTSSLSIFDSTSEYIITGNELTGKIITLSTHDVHIMTRPTIISDERYARNALLFSVGLVLRRAADPRTFRPLISKLAQTLHDMEIESRFLSDPTCRVQIQPLLERILVSLNSSQWECNLLLSHSNALNLKLFHPPKPEISPVHDYQVPILLRRDSQLQMYDWDLAINWVILHIDGVTNARQISIRAEVDLEMVLACLRVLKHHGVIALVDMFMYSNRYEFTEKATSMLAGRETKLLHDAIDFVMKRPTLNVVPPGLSTIPQKIESDGGEGGSCGESPAGISPFQFTPSSSYPPRTMSLLGGSQRSSNFRFAMTAAHSLEKESSIGTKREEHQSVKPAIAELYCACNRNLSFGDLWLSLTAELPASLAVPNLQKNAAGNNRSSIHQRNNPRKNSITDEFTDYGTPRDPIDSLALSPLETFQLESLRKPRREGSIDWADFFKRFDHRRFTSFGLVHGLLTRVHNYPFFPGTFPESPPSTTWQGTGGGEAARYEMMEEKKFTVAKSIASFMDGTRCDDELVSYFEMPYFEIIDQVEKWGGKKVVSVFASGPH